MTFNSLEFFLFLGVVIALYYRFGVVGQNRLIVAAGSVFYGLFDWRFLFLLYGSTVVDYTVGRQIEKTDDAGRRKLLLLVSVVFNLGVLGFFKYFDFFAESVTDVLGVVRLRGRSLHRQRPAAGGHQLLHVPVRGLRRRRLPARAQGRARPRHLRGVRVVVPAAGRRPHRTADVAAPAGAAPAQRPHCTPHRISARADPARPLQEGGHRRLRRRLRQHRLRVPCRLPVDAPGARHGRVRRAGLRRLLRLHRHRPGRLPPARRRAATQLRAALPEPRHP